MDRHMKKIFMGILISAMMLMMGCGQTQAGESSEVTTAQETTPTKETVTEKESTQTASNDVETTVEQDDTLIHIGSLKGPTTMGLVSLINEGKEYYDFNMVTAADELSAGVIKKTYDIVTVPANLASVLYNKTEGGVSVIDINTLGVLYVVSGDNSIKTIQDLAGKTIYLTGKGTTPEYALTYLLNAYGVDMNTVTLEFKSEATEVAAVLQNDANAIGVLPEPFATVSMTKNQALIRAVSLSDAWEELGGDSSLITGVTIVRNEFLEAHPKAVAQFLENHKASVEEVLKDPDTAAKEIGDLEIVAAPVALQALPFCNITYIDQKEMKTKLSAYLQTLFDANPQAVGGALPGDDFYYGAEN